MVASLVIRCLNHANLIKNKQIGLTLIEVLIALAIISIAMTAVIKSASQNINATGYLQNKTLAMLVGQQVINETRVGLLKIGNSSGNQKLTTKMLGQEWYWQLEAEETPNKHIKKITVKVFADENEEGSPIITLESYVYHAE
ncbi:MAG: type II secretion system minor pseudopilin GspI [Gammaproteobacteria bacterium]|nr:type II secretion system minor pseudopilin GspI [Gammaproteobacteria bacterium]MCW5583398.1 type II secretion system minor pseudopilin GspI [Gammaproteobacteria bacterium]